MPFHIVVNREYGTLLRLLLLLCVSLLRWFQYGLSLALKWNKSFMLSILTSLVFYLFRESVIQNQIAGSAVLKSEAWPQCTLYEAWSWLALWIFVNWVHLNTNVMPVSKVRWKRSVALHWHETLHAHSRFSNRNARTAYSNKLIAPWSSQNPNCRKTASISCS